MKKIQTEQSSYLIDEINHNFKRTKTAQSSLTLDEGCWTPYNNILLLEVGLPLQLTWQPEGAPEKMRITTPVISIEDVEDQDLEPYAKLVNEVTSLNHKPEATAERISQGKTWCKRCGYLLFSDEFGVATGASKPCRTIQITMREDGVADLNFTVVKDKS